jgi:hypothetical protein
MRLTTYEQKDPNKICRIYTFREINKILYLIISTYEVKNIHQNQQLHMKTNQKSPKIHFITKNSFIQIFTDFSCFKYKRQCVRQTGKSSLTRFKGHL